MTIDPDCKHNIVMLTDRDLISALLVCLKVPCAFETRCIIISKRIMAGCCSLKNKRNCQKIMIVPLNCHCEKGQKCQRVVYFFFFSSSNS